MTSRIRNQKDFAAGLIYVGAGLAFALGSLQYKIGDASRMGPGWFPLAVGLLLAAVGGIVAASALRRRAAPERLQRPQLAPLGWVIGAVVLFGLALQPLGLVLALLVLVLVASRASHEFSWRGALANGIVLAAFSTGVFIKGISLQIALWPAFLAR